MDDRDKIAMSILPAIYAEYFAACREQGTGPQDEHWREGLALDAYIMADAMLAMRGARVSAVSTVFGDMPEFPSIRTTNPQEDAR